MSVAPLSSASSSLFHLHSKESFNDVAVIAPPCLPAAQECLRTCLQSYGILSREEKVCLVECYQKGSLHRPQSFLLWVPLITIFYFSILHNWLTYYVVKTVYSWLITLSSNRYRLPSTFTSVPPLLELFEELPFESKLPLCCPSFPHSIVTRSFPLGPSCIPLWFLLNLFKVWTVVFLWVCWW